MNAHKKFYWDPETLFHFKFEANYTSKKNIVKNIIAYVENECTCENGESENDLIKDLIKQVFNN